MALYGVLGDVHGNREALLAVLAALERHAVDTYLCVGDIVGYNADSEACVELLSERGALAVAGNHDLISIGRLGFERCANKVAYSLRRTRRRLPEATCRYLASLPGHLILENRILVVHAGIRDVEQYVAAPRQILQNAAHLRADHPGIEVCIYGHVHAQKVYSVEGDEVRELPLENPVALLPDRLHFINPGSVDAARKSGPKLAQYALFDSERLQIGFYSAAYDAGASEAKAAAGGYRISAWTDRYYSLRRRFVGSL